MCMQDLTIHFLRFLKDEEVQCVAPEATDDGFAFQVSDHQSSFNF